MSSAAQRLGDFSDVLPVYSLTATELAELASIFAVDPTDVRRIPHPFGADHEAIAIRFVRGGNIPVALASYLNHEFYAPPQKTDLAHLHYFPNSYAYVADTELGEALVLTISDRPDRFVSRLRDKTTEIQYVSLHPEILFMIRPEVSYQTAKSELQKGYRPAL